MLSLRNTHSAVLSLEDGKDLLDKRYKGQFDFAKFIKVLEDVPYLAVDVSVLEDMTLVKCEELCDELYNMPTLAKRIASLWQTEFRSPLGTSQPPESALPLSIKDSGRFLVPKKEFRAPSFPNDVCERAPRTPLVGRRPRTLDPVC